MKRFILISIALFSTQAAASVHLLMGTSTGSITWGLHDVGTSLSELVFGAFIPPGNMDHQHFFEVPTGLYQGGGSINLTLSSGSSMTSGVLALYKDGGTIGLTDAGDSLVNSAAFIAGSVPGCPSACVSNEINFTPISGAHYYYRITAIVTSPSVNNYTLSSVIVPVPEASEWAMMLAGFGALGLLKKRRRKAD